MATIANQYDPNNPNKDPNQGAGGDVMPGSGGGADASSGGGGGGSSSAPANTLYQPPNVSQYLQANQGAGEQLAGGITKDVQSQANQLGSDVSNTSQDLNSKYEPLNQKLGAGGQQTIQTAFKDPQALLDSYNAAKTNSTNQPLSDQQQQQANQYNEFQQLNSGGYNGDIQGWGQQGSQAQNDLQNQYSNIAQQAGAAKNEMGRNQLLQHAVGQGNYNQGQQTLDTLFLQGSPGQQNANGLSNLQQLQQNLGGINQQANQQVQGFGQDVQSKLAALQGLSSQNQAGIKNLFLNGNDQGQGLNQIGSNVSQEAAALKASAPQQQAAIQQAFQSNQFTPEQLQQLGLSAGMKTAGLTPQEIMNAGGYSAVDVNNLNPQALNAAAANQNEFARYNALNQLAGGPSGLQNSIFGSATTTGGYNPVNFDASKLQDAVTGRQATLQNDMKTQAQNLYNAMIGQSNTTGQGFTWADDIQNNFNRNQGAISQMIKSGNFNADDLQRMASQFNYDVGPSRGAQGTVFNNWLGSTYSPAQAAQLDMSSPDTNPLTTDWASKIPRPQGK